MSAITHLERLIGEVMDLRHAADLVEWDERVYMPDGGVAVHGEMSATLRRLAHEKFTAREVGAAIEAGPKREALAEGWQWSRRDSNPGPLLCESSALTS